MAIAIFKELKMNSVKIWLAWVALALTPALPVWAQTYAFVPNQNAGTDSITRIETDGPTETNYALSDSPDGGPYGAAVFNSGTSLAVLITLVDEDQLAKIENSYFDDQLAPVVIDLPAGSQPHGVAVGTDGIYAYVANFGTGTVSKISVAGAMQVVGDPIEVGPEPFDSDNQPFAVAVHYDRATAVRKIYVTHFSANFISVITDDNGLIDVELIESAGQFEGMRGVALSPDGSRLYAADYTSIDDGSLVVVDAGNDSVIDRIPVGRGPWGVAVGGDGAYVFVANSLDERTGLGLAVVETRDNRLQRFYGVGQRPLGVAAPKNGDFAYVVNHGGNTISKVDAADQTVEADIGVQFIENAYALGAFIGGISPRTPSGLTAEPDGDAAILLTWTNNSSDATGTKIERRRQDDEIYEQIARADSGEMSFRDTGLNDETTYYYRVRAYSEGADSDYSSVASATTEESDGFSWCFVGAVRTR